MRKDVTKADSTGAVIDNHYYHAYDQLSNFSNPPLMNLLYAGDTWDSDLDFYYNRARWYDPTVGRFNRMDPFAGNNRDPQSLHKYLYVHCNPVNGIDPTGEFFTSIGAMSSTAWQATLRKIDWVKVSVMGPIVAKISQWANRGYYSVYHATKSSRFTTGSIVDLAKGFGRWGRGFYTAARQNVALAEAKGSEFLLRVQIYLNKVLDLTNPRVVSYVEKSINKPGAVQKIMSAPSGQTLKEAITINDWAVKNGYDAIKVFSTQAAGEINYLIINGQPIIDQATRVSGQ